MKNSLLFALLGAVYLAVDGHLFTYDDEQPEHYDGYHYSPSYIVSNQPPGLRSNHGYGRYQRYYPSYYVSRTLPRWPQRPHGHGPLYTYPDLSRSIYREGRTKKKKYGGKPIKGGWWYKWTKKGLVSGRWGAPPPPGLEKEHYIYGGNGGGWGWGGGGYGGGHGGGHGSHGPWGGHPPFYKHVHGGIAHAHGGPAKHHHGKHHHGPHGHHKQSHHGPYGGHGYGGGGGWGWQNQGWGW